jgi:hypothetical protein
MRSLSRILVVVAVSLAGYLALGCGVGVGTGGVYVGVAVPGPYVGYPGYPGYIGRPPVVYYEEDALLLLVEPGELYAQTALEDESEVVCPSEPDPPKSCVSVPSEASAPDDDTGADPAGGGR